MLKKGANQVFKTRMFDEKGEHKGYEWAEFVMAINHMLWFWNDYEEKNATEYLEPVLKALNDLYYEWHGKAIHNLKGDTLSEYLRITD